MPAIRLTTLGSPDLQQDGQAAHGVIQQPKRLALLVYLTLESRNGSVRRDSILGVFWPDQTQSSARRSLNTALHFLRKALGEEVITSRSADEIAVNTEAVSCDVLDFLDALDQGRDRDAAVLYAGEFLHGFYVENTPDFQDWLDRTRDRLRTLAADAVWRCAEQARAAGDDFSAAAFARRAADLALGSEAMVRRQIELLIAIGDREGAYVAHRELSRRLEEYGDAPDPLTTRLLDAQPVRAPVPMQAASVDAPVEPIAAPSHNPARGWRSRAFQGAATVGFFVIFVSLWGLVSNDRIPPLPREATVYIEQVSVLPESVPQNAGPELFNSVVTHLIHVKRLASILPPLEFDSVRGGPPRTAYLFRIVISGNGDAPLVRAFVVAPDRSTYREKSWPFVGASEPDSSARLTMDIASFLRTAIGAHMQEEELKAENRVPRALELVQLAVDDRACADSLMRAEQLDESLRLLGRADSLLAAAAVVEPKWPEIPRQRAETALRRMFASLKRDAARDSALRQGLAYTDAVLAMDSGNIDARELRAIFRAHNWHFAPLGVHVPPAATLIAELQAITMEDPWRPRAWNRIAALQMSTGDLVGAWQSAENAYRTDTFLDERTDILARLFSTALEVGKPDIALQRCGELVRLLNDPWVAPYCRLRVSALKETNSIEDAVKASADAATVLPDTDDNLGMTALLESAAAVVNAGAGRRAEALALLASARARMGGESIAPEYDALAYLRLGERDKAKRILLAHVLADTARNRGLLMSHRFAALRSDDDIKRLLPGSK